MMSIDKVRRFATIQRGVRLISAQVLKDDEGILFKFLNSDTGKVSEITLSDSYVDMLEDLLVEIRDTSL